VQYASKKHMKASVFMHSWATERWPGSVLGGAEDEGIELYVEAGIEPPASRS
jgi:G2/mitotic-specific cyclin 1/2